MFRPGDNPKNNCVASSEFYYISSYEQYKGLKIYQCPEEAKYKIKEKNACIDDYKKDKEYIYLYNGNCVKNCPSDTEVNNYICEVNSNECSYGENEIYLYNNNLDAIEILAKSYTSEFTYTNNHISLYKNDNYSVMIYKNQKCIKELDIQMPNINFESCYKKVQEAYNIQEDLIVSVADKKILKNPITFFSFFHPVSGEKLDADTICKNDKVIIEENLYELLDKNNNNYKTQTSLTDQGINIFDKNHPFYTDLCYDYKNEKKKDIPLSCRIRDIYPNASLCDEGCIYESINLEDMTSKCNCDFNDILKNDLIDDNEILNSVVGEIFDLINSSNILVLKCIRYMFKYFTTSIGSWLSLFLIILDIIMIILYFSFDINKIKIYIMKITEIFIENSSKPGFINKNFPPKKNRSIHNKKNYDILISNITETKSNKFLINNSKKKILPPVKRNQGKKLVIFNRDITESVKLNKQSDNQLYPISEKENKSDSNFFETYFENTYDDMDYNDAMFYDKRKFCESFCDCLKSNQITASTFIDKDELKPRSIKIIIFILNFLLYFVVNGLFFSEEVIEKLYEVDENKEHFFSYFLRSINRIIYCALVSIVIGYIEDFFFLDKNKLKGIFMREKDKINILNEKIVEFMNDIKRRNISFIIFSGIIIIFSFIYLSCFNYVYKYSQIEWIKSSITIVIIMQILSFLKCLLISSLRVLSFKCKSEKIYKISKLLY